MSPDEPSPEIKLRPGRTEDALNFHQLDRICFPANIAFTLDLFQHHLRDHNSINLVAEKMGANDRPVAMAGFIVASVFRKSGQVVTMDINPDYRKMGIGESLLDECEKMMAQMGARESVLQVAVNNEPAYRLYIKKGYRPIARLPGYYPHPHPRGTDAIFMQKNLTD